MEPLPPFTSEFQPYSYQELNPDQSEIRVAELLPGKFTDDVRIKIKIVSIGLELRGSFVSVPFGARDLQRTVRGWSVFETLQGRFLFVRDTERLSIEPYDTSWIHPVAGIEPAMTQDVKPTHVPAYEALSYVWGLETDESIIYVETPGLAPGYLRIRGSLAVALRHLRSETAARVIWADGICINQKDLIERSQQVQLMGRIYKFSQRVIVWLGPAQDNSELAMRTLDYLGQQVALTDSGTLRWNAPNCQHPTWALSLTSLPYDETTWSAIADLCRREWFSRVWTWQEAKLSNSRSLIQCGKETISLYTFVCAASCLVPKCATRPQLRILFENARDTTFSQLDAPFLDTLFHLASRTCLENRDKIYGGLGLAPIAISTLISTDYTIPLVEIYTSACTAICRETSRLDFLLACNLGARSVDGPTWVPDLSKPPERPQTLQRLSLNAVQASGIAVSEAEVKLDETPTLSVQAVRYTVIKKVGAKVLHQQPKAIASIVRAWALLCDPPAKYATQETWFDAFVKAVYEGRLRERTPDHRLCPTLAQARTIVNRLVTQQNLEDYSTQSADDSTHLPDLTSLSFFTTESGYMGTTSSTPKPGDVVCVILGCAMPVILRNYSSGMYNVVGASHVSGLMDAEAFLGPLDSAYTFRLGNPSNGAYRLVCYDKRQGTSMKEDPRLGPLPPEWVKLEAKRLATDPWHFVRYRSLVTGRTINGDPRLLPAALKSRGVDLETLHLL